MIRSRLILLALLAPMLLLVAAPTAAAKRRLVVVGIGEQTVTPFGSKRFAATGIRTMRLVVPYDLVRARGRRLRETDSWMLAARAGGIDPLVSFTKRGRRGRRYLPSVREYIRNVGRFRKRYPWVHIFATWNEANLPNTQPTGHNPIRTAAYYRAFRKRCRRRCTLLAPEFLATATKVATRWLATFARHAGRGPHIWAVHTYPDANRFRTFRTRRFLRTVPRGKVWITETGGIVKFHRFRRNTRRAARAVRQSFELARMSRRIKRIYIYNWSHAPWNPSWDSALVTFHGRPRPAFRTLTRFIRRSPLFKVKRPKAKP